MLRHQVNKSHAKMPTRRRSLPPLNALRAFEAAARLGSFKDAAAELTVTHGAISRHIRLLEQWLRAPLFERYNRRVVLTPAARAYLSKIQPALDQVAFATARYGYDHGTVLRVNVLATFALRWLVPRMAKFQKQHPNIRVRLETSNEPLDALQESYDIIIRGGPDTFYGYSASPFLSEARLPVCSPKLLKRVPLRIVSDLKRHTLLHTLSLPRLWSDWLVRAGVHNFKPEATLILDHFYLTLQAALDGLGVAMGPTALIEDDLVKGRLIAPFPGPLLPARTYCSYATEARMKDEIVVAFRSWLKKEGDIADFPAVK